MSEEVFTRRSENWFALKDKHGFIYRERLRNQGYAPDVFINKLVIGIASTWSKLNPCNGHLNRVAEAVKRSVWESGGFPLEFPAMSLGEPIMRPTTMLYRNLLAMETEELLIAAEKDVLYRRGIIETNYCRNPTVSVNPQTLSEVEEMLALVEEVQANV